MNATRCLCLVALLSGAVACKPEPPPADKPPEPQAAVATPAAEQHTELRDAIQAPQDKARAVEGQVEQAADAQRDAIDAQAQ
ncbi:hypothetical protein J5837_04305 [Pseudoxanthomonas helianthi]|uniref:Lipoprotein n=1 Tax=Pseudoxanthomonas helianthi TaxID=1453541 RepID=A0A941ASM3_9GAMM|nr:hypothetical protein [Pseudoxanthomonas helianthi]MBP3983641.1 hypothetical protein [Pseudoxanthomonas helianthi]